MLTVSPLGGTANTSDFSVFFLGSEENLKPLGEEPEIAVGVILLDVGLDGVVNVWLDLDNRMNLFFQTGKNWYILNILYIANGTTIHQQVGIKL